LPFSSWNEEEEEPFEEKMEKLTAQLFEQFEASERTAGIRLAFGSNHR